MNTSQISGLLRGLDPGLKFLVVLSTVIYLAELSTGASHSHEAPPFFLWAECIITIIFTSEYALRWLDDALDHYGWHYPHSPLGLVDLVSILPFWVEFFVPLEWWHFLRAFRTFRLLKFTRYSRPLQLVALGFYRAWPHLRALGFAMFIVGLFCMVSVYEAEKPAQPEKFDSLFSAAYFTMVTVATVGYGDLVPVTTLGRSIAMATFLFALSIFAGMIGVIGNSLVKILEEAANPNLDPIDVYLKERERVLAMKAANRRFRTTYNRPPESEVSTPPAD